VQHACPDLEILPKEEKNMRRTRKSTKVAPEKNEIVDSFVPLYSKSIERAAELQKKSLDVAFEQSAELMAVWKKVLHMVPGTPGLFMIDVFAQMFERYVETQKGAIDIATEQGHAAAGLAKERGGYAGRIGEGMSTLMQRSLEHSIAAQKKALDSFAEQNKSMYEAAKRQFRFSGTPASEAFQTGLDTLIETQKTMLDIASKPLHKATAA
jgi:hypothetical protein